MYLMYLVNLDTLYPPRDAIRLHPQIERNELAIRISEDEQLNIQDSYRSKINTQKSKNLAVAVENKIIRDENFAQVVPRKVSV